MKNIFEKCVLPIGRQNCYAYTLTYSGTIHAYTHHAHTQPAQTYTLTITSARRAYVYLHIYMSFHCHIFIPIFGEDKYGSGTTYF